MILKILSIGFSTLLFIGCGSSDRVDSSSLNDKETTPAKSDNVNKDEDTIYNKSKDEENSLDIIDLSSKISTRAINTDPIGREIVTRQYLHTQDFYDSEVVVSSDDYKNGKYHHYYQGGYILKMNNSFIRVDGVIYGYIQGKNGDNDGLVSTWIRDNLLLGSQSRQIGIHTFMLPSNDTDRFNRQELITPIHQTYNNLGIKGKEVPIVFSRSIEYLTGMSEGRKLRNVDERSYLLISETEYLPTQSLPKFDIKEKIINSLKEPKKDIDIINWNIHFHHETDGSGIKREIDKSIDQNNTVVIALEETIGKYTTTELFKEQGDKWFYLEMPTYQQYWLDAKSIDSDKKKNSELFELSKVLASNKPFTDIRYFVFPYTSESYKNHKSAIAGKLDGIWFIVAHFTSVEGVNNKQLMNLKEIIVNELNNPEKLVVMGDFNIPIEDESVQNFILDLGLVSSFEGQSTWCGTGEQQIDYILVKGVDFKNGRVVDTCEQSDHKMVRTTLRSEKL
jgi:endonuclease/exonuclease/phosphatase family metal-dependent hydrolase